jgi:ABC-type amino acid transport substrate-binding protein
MRGLVLVFCAAAFFVSSASAAERTGTLKTIESSGTFKLGFRPDAPPMSFIDSAGQPAGYSIDLCRAVALEVATTLGRKDLSVQFVPVTASDRFASVVDGRVDILCESTTKTLSRAETVDFTQLTFVTGATLLSRANARIQSVSQLQGKKVAAIRDTTTIEALKQALGAAFIDAEIVAVGSATDGFEAMAKGNVVALAADQIVAIGIIRSVTDGGNILYLSPELFSKEVFALAVRRNDADFRLVADRALSRLYRSRRIEAVYTKWFAGLAPAGLLGAIYELNATPD